MNPFEMAEIGKTGLRVTRLGLGTSPLGLLDLVTDRQATAITRGAFSLGIRYVDTAPAYGLGRAELRLRRSLEKVPRDSYVVSTKVGWSLKGTENIDFRRIPPKDFPELTRYHDFSRDAILRCFERSLQSLGLEKVDILYFHDVPDEHYQQAIKEGYPTLAELRSQGMVKAIGAGLGNLRLLVQFIKEGDFDCFLLHQKYTLLDQSALSEFLPLCLERGISIIIGGPYDGGLIFGLPHYVPIVESAPRETKERVRRLRAVCDKYRVPVSAAALQLVSAHPAVVSVIPGPRSVQEVKDNIRMMQHPTPSQFWDELRQERLIPNEAPTPKE